MASMTSAGSSIAIGLAPATNTLVGLQAVSYSPIGEVTNIGSFGKNSTLLLTTLWLIVRPLSAKALMITVLST